MLCSVKFLLVFFAVLPICRLSLSQNVIFGSHRPIRRPFNRNPAFEKTTVIFPTPEIYSSVNFCPLTSGETGICVTLNECPEIKKQILKGLKSHVETTCGWKGPYIPLVCCPQDNHPRPVYDITPPVADADDFYPCGALFYQYDHIDLRTIYSFNETAEEYRRRGFTVTPIDVSVDKLLSFNAKNATHSEVIEDPTGYVVFAIGGEPARKIVTIYMALLGEQHGNKHDWFCDGVIINRDWVLSAAHCFLSRTPNVVRLGEYDLSNNAITKSEFPMDFGIRDVVIYPDYQHPSNYHDLALIRLNRTIPFHRPDMRPVCLPWGEEISRDLIGEQLTLTGWGATIFQGPSTPVVQEVNVTVFDASVCDKSYSTLRDYSSKFPNGIKKETSLCAGDIEGGKDACQGDSGGPVVYENSVTGLYTLAGIVSTGFGCGLKEYPGIYAPIHRPEYLSWIKKVAFT